MCGSEQESIDHLIGSCQFEQSVWNMVSSFPGVNLAFSGGFGSGNWISDRSYSLYIKSIITAAFWFLWKARCGNIFQNTNVSCQSVVCRALTGVFDSYNASRSLSGWKLIHNNFYTSDGPFLFTSTFRNDNGLVSGAGFFISRSNCNIMLAGVPVQWLLNLVSKLS